jgi:hypothetical protein
MTKPERGAVQRTANAYDNMITGTIGAGFPAQAIYQQQQACLEVLVQNDPSSAVNVYVGPATAQYVVLVPGASITIPINNVNRIWAGTDGGAATVNWIAMT